MKKIFLTFLIFSTIAFANGVGVIDASNDVYLKLISSNVQVTVENQVAIVKTTQVFKNTTVVSQKFKYAFPMDEKASATSLRWKMNGQWKSAVITSGKQDSTLPGGGGAVDANLTQYLGKTPLYFGINDPLDSDSTVTVELTYVEFLKYEFGNVTFTYPNDYSLIQSDSLQTQQIDFKLNSSRKITSIQAVNHNPSTLTNNGNTAEIICNLENQQANKNYKILYSLSLNELGLFSLSTMMPDSLVPDTSGNGYFLFVAEPDPSNKTNIINKVFTLIIDRSGSMMGVKMDQAKNAAKFIVENLNSGDKFNIVDFSDNISSFRSTHVDYNEQNKTDALAYISSFNAGGSTNISGAFDTAVPQFSAVNDSTANIIIFLTDGQQTAGITNQEQLLSHIHNIIQSTEKNVMVFTFGIGQDVNKQMLSLLATNNQGFAQFLGNDQLESVLTNFYLQIRNPVLLNTKISFSSNNISEVFPNPLPNLYKGQQMIVSGRYNRGDSTKITLSGTAFGKAIQYDYTLNLSDSIQAKYSFLPKAWAKGKIENLLVQYYNLASGSTEALKLKEEIVQLSIEYGIITEFTSYTTPTTGVEEQTTASKQKQPINFKLLGNYPNPFNPSTTIKFFIGKNIHDVVKVKIFNSIGELVKTLVVRVNGSGYYEVRWDGKFANGNVANSGVYVYVVEFGNQVYANKMILLK